MSHARVTHLVARARGRWLEEPCVTSLRATLARELKRDGSVLNAREAAEMARGSPRPEVAPARSFDLDVRS